MVLASRFIYFNDTLTIVTTKLTLLLLEQNISSSEQCVVRSILTVEVAGEIIHTQLIYME